MSSPADVVYAVFPFEAEAEDEIALGVGEQVIVLERDDVYNDGWWRGRNASGKEGLFPESYTSRNKPAGAGAASSSSAAAAAGRPSVAVKPPSVISRVSEEEDDDHDDEEGTGAFMQTSLASAFDRPSPGLSKSDSFATANNSSSNNRSALAARAKEQIEKAAREQQRRKNRPAAAEDDNASFAGSTNALDPAPVLEFSDESDEEEFGAGLLSQQQPRRYSKSIHRSPSTRGQDLPHQAPPPAQDPTTTPEQAPTDGTAAAATAAAEGSDPNESPVANSPRVLPPENTHQPDAATTEQVQQPAEQSDAAASLLLNPNAAQLNSSQASYKSEISNSGFSDDNSANHVSTSLFPQPPQSNSNRVHQDHHGTDNMFSGILDPSQPSTSTPVVQAPPSPPKSHRSLPGDEEESHTQKLGKVAFPAAAAGAAGAVGAGVFAADQHHEPEQATSPPSPGKQSARSAQRESPKLAQHSSPRSIPQAIESSPDIDAPLSSGTPRPARHNASSPTHSPHLSDRHSSGSRATTAADRQILASPQSAASTAHMPPPPQSPPPETPTTDVNSRPYSHAGSAMNGKQSSLGTANTSPRSSVASKSPPLGDPRSWSVEQVVDWAKSKALDSYICDKLMEHEIAGDILLEMDLESLKEIDLPAFGRRVRIFNAIKELRKTVEPAQRSQQPSYNWASPALSGYEPDTPSVQGGAFSPNTSMGLNPLASSQRSQPDQPHYRPDRQQASFGSIDQIVNRGLPSEMDPRKAEMRGLGLRNGSQPAPMPHETAPSEDIEPRQRTTSTQSDLSGVTSEVKSDEEPTQDSSIVNERQIMSDSEAVLETRKKANVLNNTALNRSNPSLAPSASTRASGKRADSAADKANKRSSWYQMDKSATSPFANKTPKIPGSAIFSGAGRKARKPPPQMPPGSPAAESSQPSTPRQKGGRLSIATMGKQGSKLFGLGLGSGSGSESERPTVGDPRLQPPATRPKSAARTNSDERAFDWIGQHDGPAVMASPNPLAQIGQPDVDGWLKKRGQRTNTWKPRYVLLKNRDLYLMKSPKESQMKGWIHLTGYKILPDPDTARGHYGFKIVHATHPPHFFASEDVLLIKKFMKNLMKIGITRGTTENDTSTSKVPTIPLEEAQAQFPPPRPPSPTSRSNIQKARRGSSNPNTLSPRDAETLMSHAKESPTSPNINTSVPASTGTAPTSSRSFGRFSMLRTGNLGKSQTSLSSTAGISSADSPTDVMLNPPLSASTNGSNRHTPMVQEDAKEELASPADADEAAPAQPTSSTPPLKQPESPAELLQWVNTSLPQSSPKASSFGTSFRSGQLLYLLIRSLSGETRPTLEEQSQYYEVTADNSLDHFDTIFELFDFMDAQKIKTGDVSMGEVLNGQEAPTMKLVNAIRSRFSGSNEPRQIR